MKEYEAETKPDPLVDKLRERLDVAYMAMADLQGQIKYRDAADVAVVIEHLANAIRALEGR